MGMCARMRIQGLNQFNRGIHTNVLEPDLAIPGARDEFDHSDAGFKALVEEADGAVAEAGSEDVTGDLVGG